MRTLSTFFILLLFIQTTFAEIEAGLGIMVGELSESKVHIQVRLNNKGTFEGVEGKIEFRLKPIVNGKIITQTLAVSPKKDFIARATFEDLKENTKYVCTTRIYDESGKETVGPIARFKTLPGKTLNDDVSFVVTTGMNFAKFFHFDKVKKAKKGPNILHLEYTDVDKHLGYPALETIQSFKPDFFVGTGDNVYYDSPDAIAKTKGEIRHKYHQQFSLQRFKDLFAEVPTYWEIDDHDYRKNDCDRSGNYLPSPATGRAMMLEQLPVSKHDDDDDALTYRTVRVNKNLQVWFVENRMYRSDNTDKDGPGKTIWGDTQKKWLKKTLLESDADYK
ncbi:MAG: alkaline phosphatase D family protein, partial [Lentisphaeraceae bacterium]|nr:alkaline phosphatase D family protein [Lentisphaeraceae bacterium]